MRWIRRASRPWRLAAALALAGLGGCPDVPNTPRYLGAGAAEPQRGGTLMLWHESRVRMLDPHVAFDVTSGILVEMLYDSLYDYDHQTKLTPRLAEGMPEASSDGLSFVVRLRKGVRFHNGRKLTAHDVVWSFERMLHPDLASPGAPYYQAIAGFAEYQKKTSAHLSGLRAIDDQTVQFKLSKPDQSFVHTLAMRFSSPVPKEEVLARGTKFKRSVK